ncbi:MAG TPA: hypothetical protein VJ935_10415 [Acidimicrobiia bacterium]|nr:hypothetical protein [Acidimicrobiia bacterium]
MENLIADLRLRYPYSRVLGRLALALAFSAVLHLAIAIARGWDLQGAVSFRKPVTFAVSFSLMFWAMGWLIDRFPRRPRLGWPIAIGLAGGGMVETGLITMQSWRGEASHFNFESEFDAGVFSVMGMTIGLVSLALLAIAIWTFVESPPGLKLPMGTGMVLILLGLGLGVPLIEMGVKFWETVGIVPDHLTVGAAGVAKFPHAIALHGIQVFILAVVVGNRLPIRTALVRLASGGYLAIVGWSIVHTNSGRAPADPTGIESILLFGGLGAFMAAAALVWTRSRISRSPSTLPA